MVRASDLQNKHCNHVQPWNPHTKNTVTLGKTDKAMLSIGHKN
jgi:hypothetical protein